MAVPRAALRRLAAAGSVRLTSCLTLLIPKNVPTAPLRTNRRQRVIALRRVTPNSTARPTSLPRRGSHPDELVDAGHELGYAALAITDRNSLAGVVRATPPPRIPALKLLIGAEVHSGRWPAHRRCWADRSRGLRPTLPPAHGRPAAREERRLPAHLRRCRRSRRRTAGQRALPRSGGTQIATRRSVANLRRPRATSPAELHHGPDDGLRLEQFQQLARETGIPLVACQRRALPRPAASPAGRAHRHPPRLHRRTSSASACSPTPSGT